MATWVRNGTGTAPAGTDANVTGAYALDNSTAPGDFDPAAVSSVRVQWTMGVTAGTFVDDSYSIEQVETYSTSAPSQISTHTPTNTGPLQSGTTSVANDVTDSAGIPVGWSTTNWQDLQVRGIGGGSWSVFTGAMKADGVTVAVTALTVTITYTPATTDRKARVAFAEMEVPNAPRKARVAFAELEVPNAMPDWIRGWEKFVESTGSTTITIQKPSGTVENDLMYALILHETSFASFVSETPPSGWSDVGTVPLDIGVATGLLYKKTAGASEPTSYTWTVNPSNQMVGVIITVKNTYAEDAITSGNADDTDADSDVDITLSGISTSATGLLTIIGTDAVTTTPSPYYATTSGGDQRYDSLAEYGGAVVSWFTETLSSQTSSTENITLLDASMENAYMMVSFAPASTDRKARVSFGELEVPDAPRKARVSFAELEVPTAPRRARVAFAEMEIPTAPRRAQVSFSEFEVPNAPRRGRVAFATLEVPDAPRKVRVSFAELETGDGARRARVSFAEMEIPTAPRKGRVSYAAFETPNAPTSDRRAQVSFAEFEVPTAPRRGRVSFAEMEASDAPRRSRVSFAEFEIPTAPRKAQVSWAELEVPTSPRRAQVAFAEFEVPTSPRKARVSFAELETPSFARRCVLVWCVLETPNAPTVGKTRTRMMVKFTQ